ncbi:MAG TPA: NAD(P)H-dependent oxidoreductase [Thermoguttaceae bacterium]|nr:NAD(P)H-dependent oxidoreductase [Thermoguttaceae bacterium]
MKILVVIGHQHKGSFCHAIVETAIGQLESAGHEVIFHDLYEEQFDPILPQAEIPPDAELDPVVCRHRDEVSEADGYLIVHPNWWAQPPAVLKGWLDRVLRQGHHYRFGPEGVIGMLTGKKALVFTTSNTPREAELELYGDPLENLWKTCVFGFCGVEDFYRRNFESIVMSTPEQRAGWLEDVRHIVGKRFPA